MENPRATNPTRAVALQKYLLLHSQRGELIRRINSSSFASLSAPSSPTRIPEDPEDDEEQLISINNQTKAILIELLNCVSPQGDPSFRAWVQSRLSETERELSLYRNEAPNQSSAGRRYSTV
ncbi:hypothetical protein FGG08_000512 [Glutinoglossum americanum]|uniref:Uncharacterized protein n=1 Tax=Glutinoglossum americanum TaxID=1670608 RepID=A0A9P8I3N3_9PEZI|nr:hypothetical protein FGG08_000512 [Glutinoglossum americanum]